jgi:hypothetical protein
MLSEVALRQFAELYRKKFGSEITDEEITKVAAKLLAFFRLIYSPPEIYTMAQDEQTHLHEINTKTIRENKK